MKTFLKQFILFFVICLLAGCQKYDDSGIQKKMSELDSRVTSIENQCKQINQDINNLKTIVNALENRCYVTEVKQISDGYTIYFSNGESITIKNGKDGHTPVISVKQGSDNIWYWTVDGNWLLDSNGNKVPTTGTNGKDGVTPVMKIENDYWYVSIDEGKTWSKLGKAKGEDGDSFFKEVTQDENHVYLVMASGETIVLDKKRDFEIKIDSDTEIICFPGTKLEIPYFLNNAGNKIEFTTLCEGNWNVSVQKKDETSGKVLIEVPDPFTKAKVVLLGCSDGVSDMKVLTFEEGYCKAKDGKTKLEIAKEGGKLSIVFLSNLSISLKPDESSSSWISAESTKAEITKSITVQENMNYDPRTGKVLVCNGDTQMFSLEIEQSGGARLSINKESVSLSGYNQSVDVKVTANSPYDVNVSDGADWLIIDKVSTDNYQISVKANISGSKRTGFVAFTSEDKTVTEILTIQQESIIAVQSITVSGGGNLGIGYYYDINVSYTPSNADVDFEWTVSDSRVAELIYSTKTYASLKTMDYGTTTITYRDKNTGISGSCKVDTYVMDFAWNNPSPSSTYASNPLFDLAIGDTFQLKWTSSPYTQYLFCNLSNWVFYEPNYVVSAPSHISVSETGLVKGESVGITGMKATGGIIGTKDRVYFNVVSEYPEKEPNNDFPYATEMKQGFPMSFKLSSRTDVDVIKFFPASPQNFKFTVTYKGDGGSGSRVLGWEMYNSSYDLLGSGTLPYDGTGGENGFNKFLNTSSGYFKFFFPSKYSSYPEMCPNGTFVLEVK